MGFGDAAPKTLADGAGGTDTPHVQLKRRGWAELSGGAASCRGCPRSQAGGPSWHPRAGQAQWWTWSSNPAGRRNRLGQPPGHWGGSQPPGHWGGSQPPDAGRQRACPSCRDRKLISGCLGLVGGWEGGRG